MNEVFLAAADAAGREAMEEALAACPDYRGEMWVGKSIMSTPIKAFPIGRGKRLIFLCGAHHGAESITANLLYAIAYACLTEISAFGIDIPHLLESFTFVVLPAVNPDGIEISLHGPTPGPLMSRQLALCPDGDFQAWQANARGVDLNHNYDAGFPEYKDLERREGILPGRTKYSGEYPESEPESRCVAGLVRALAPEAVVSLHSQGEEIFYTPRAGRIGERSLNIAEGLSGILGYRISSPMGTAAYGGLCDYTGALGIPSFTIECGKGKNPLPPTDIPHIFPRLFPAILSLPTFL